MAKIRVEEITLREIRLPLVERFVISSGWMENRRILLLEIRDADGASAWAECVAGSQPNYSPETIDTAWLARYEHRTEHPPDDAEKAIVVDGRVTRIHRQMPEAEAHGEYIGVAKFSAAGAARLRDAYHRCRREFAGKPWREAKVFEKAYKILLFQEMIEAGEHFAHVDTPGGYIEVDTQQDFEYARRYWTARHLRK